MKREALIYRPAKSAMQSGTKNMNQWKVEIRNHDGKFVDPTMGWIGSTDTTRQLSLHFNSEGAAIKYCESKGLDWHIADDNERKFKPKSYANNFSTAKRRYSDIAANNKINL